MVRLDRSVARPVLAHERALSLGLPCITSLKFHAVRAADDEGRDASLDFAFQRSLRNFPW